MMTVKCNHVPRDVLSWYELTESEQREFNWLDTDERRDEAQFFRYRGNTYSLSEFMRIGPPTAPHCDRPDWEKFDGYASDSFFSGVLVKYVDGGERVIAATYFS